VVSDAVVEVVGGTVFHLGVGVGLGCSLAVELEPGHAAADVFEVAIVRVGVEGDELVEVVEGGVVGGGGVVAQGGGVIEGGPGRGVDAGLVDDDRRGGVGDGVAIVVAMVNHVEEEEAEDDGEQDVVAGTEAHAGLGLLLTGGADLESGRAWSASLLGVFLLLEAAFELLGEFLVLGPGAGAGRSNCNGHHKSSSDASLVSKALSGCCTTRTSELHLQSNSFETTRKSRSLVGAVDEILGEGLEGGGGFAEGGEGGEGVGDELGGVFFGLLDAVDGGPGGFDGGGVFAGRLAELGGGLGHVEDVVDDLEGEAGAFAEGPEMGDDVGVAGSIRIPPVRKCAYGWGTRFCGKAEEAAADDAGGDEGSGFGAVDALD
jgi:hypothetical protein